MCLFRRSLELVECGGERGGMEGEKQYSFLCSILGTGGTAL